MSHYPHKTWPGWWTIDYEVIDHIQKGDKVVKTTKRIREHVQVETEEEAADYEHRVRGTHVSKTRTHMSPPFKDIAAEFKIWATSYQRQRICHGNTNAHAQGSSSSTHRIERWLRLCSLPARCQGSASLHRTRLPSKASV